MKTRSASELDSEALRCVVTTPWRKVWDLNPWIRCRINGVRDRPFRPLRQPSVGKGSGFDRCSAWKIRPSSAARSVPWNQRSCAPAEDFRLGRKLNRGPTAGERQPCGMLTNKSGTMSLGASERDAPGAASKHGQRSGSHRRWRSCACPRCGELHRCSSSICRSPGPQNLPAGTLESSSVWPAQNGMTKPDGVP